MSVGIEDEYLPLGHPDHHFNKHPEHPWLKTKDEMEGWLKRNCKKINKSDVGFLINKDLTVDLDDSVKIKNKTEYLPIKFRKVNGIFSLYDNDLKSLIGTPHVAISLYLHNNKIENFEGLSENIKSSIYVSYNNIKSFEHLPYFKSSIFLELSNNPIKSWDNFTNVEKIVWWQEYFSENSLELLINAPESINTIMLNENFRSKDLRFKKKDIVVE